MARCKDVDVTKENALFRSGAKMDNILGQMQTVMSKREDIPMLCANQIGINKNVIVLRTRHRIHIESESA